MKTIAEYKKDLINELQTEYSGSLEGILNAFVSGLFMLEAQMRKEIQQSKKVIYTPKDQGGTIPDLIRWSEQQGGDKLQSAFVQPCFDGPGTLKIVTVPHIIYDSKERKPKQILAVDNQKIEDFIRSKLAPAVISVESPKDQFIDLTIKVRGDHASESEIERNIFESLVLLFKINSEPWFGGDKYGKKANLFNKKLKTTASYFDFSKFYDALVYVDHPTPSVVSPSSHVEILPGHILRIGEININYES